MLLTLGVEVEYRAATGAPRYKWTLKKRSTDKKKTLRKAVMYSHHYESPRVPRPARNRKRPVS